MKSDFLSIALVGPNDLNRLEITRQLSGPEVGVLRDYYLHFDVEDLIAQKHDVVIMDLDHDPEGVLKLVRRLGASGVTTLMVYSAHSEPGLPLRALNAGAHEFLVVPLPSGAMSGALTRALARRPDEAIRGEDGELLVFFGVKGGVGVTTIATNFALLLARESGKKTLLIDLDLPLGDVGLNLGLTGKYSTVDALANVNRLDRHFLATLLQPYKEQLWVLAAPGHFMNVNIHPRAIDKLIAVARLEFDYVVVDSGSRLNFLETDLHKRAGTIYMVTQTGLPELRNANRLIGQLPSQDPDRTQIVINRYASTFHSVDEDTVSKVLTRPADWKIPNDYGTAFRTQTTATPLAFEDSPISEAIQQMASAACKAPREGGEDNTRGLFSMFR